MVHEPRLALILIAAVALSLITACATRRDDGMGNTRALSQEVGRIAGR